MPDAASRPVGSSSRCRPCGCTRSPASPTATAASRTPPPASPRRCATPSTPPWAPSPAPCASRAAAEVKGRPPARPPSRRRSPLAARTPASGAGGAGGRRGSQISPNVGFLPSRSRWVPVSSVQRGKPAEKKRWGWARRSPRVERTRTEQARMAFTVCNVFLFIH